MGLDCDANARADGRILREGEEAFLKSRRMGLKGGLRRSSLK